MSLTCRCRTIPILFGSAKAAKVPCAVHLDKMVSLGCFVTRSRFGGAFKPLDLQFFDVFTIVYLDTDVLMFWIVLKGKPTQEKGIPHCKRMWRLQFQLRGTNNEPKTA